MCRGQLSRERRSAPKGGDCQIILAEALCRDPEHQMGVGKVGFQLGGVAETGGCLRQPVAVDKRDAKVVMGRGIAGIETDRLLQRCDRFGKPARLAQAPGLLQIGSRGLSCPQRRCQLAANRQLRGVSIHTAKLSGIFPS